MHNVIAVRVQPVAIHVIVHGARDGKGWVRRRDIVVTIRINLQRVGLRHGQSWEDGVQVDLELAVNRATCRRAVIVGRSRRQTVTN